MTIRKSLVYSYLDRYASLIISIVSSMIIARLLTPADFDQFVDAVSDSATPMILYTGLSSAIAHRVVQLAERSTVELVFRGHEDVPLITHKLGLDDINHGFDLMARGESIRSVVVY